MQIDGGNIYNAGIALSPPNGSSKTSGPLYVQKSAAAVLSLFSTGLQPSDASGMLTFDIQSPTPLPATLGQLLSVSVPPATLLDWRYDIATAGKHLLCFSYIGPTDSGGATRSAASSGDRSPPSRTTAATSSARPGDHDRGDRRPVGGHEHADLDQRARRGGPGVGAPGADRAGDGAGRRRERQRQHRPLRAPLPHLRRGRGPGLHGPRDGSVRRQRAGSQGAAERRRDGAHRPAVQQQQRRRHAAGARRRRRAHRRLHHPRQHSSGTYVIEVDADGDGAGSYSLSLASP